MLMPSVFCGCSINMAGNAVLLSLLPAAAKLGEGYLCAALSIMGAFQVPH